MTARGAPRPVLPTTTRAVRRRGSSKFASAKFKNSLNFAFVTLHLIAAVIGLHAAAADQTAAAPTPAGRLSSETLRRNLNALFAAPAVQHVQWGVTFRWLNGAADKQSVALDRRAAADTARALNAIYALNPSRFMIPASGQKILTTAVAAERLGWDYRFTTRLLATAPIGGDGVLAGDLVVIGSGDPTINPRHPERVRAFDAWAAALRAQGLVAVSGRLIGDDNRFAEPGWGVGWAWDNLAFGYGSPTSALQYNENQTEITITPADVGQAAAVVNAHEGSGLRIESAVVTVARGLPPELEIVRVPGSDRLTVRGRVAVGAKPSAFTASVVNPTLFYAAALREALGRQDITVQGGIVDIDELPSLPSWNDAMELLVDRSPPLLEIADVTMKWSRNLYAESMLHALATPDEEASGSSGVKTLRDTLTTWQVLDDQYLSRDGSGLSRYDYVTADALSAVLTQMWRDPRHREPFRSTLPVAGSSGTLANRMKGTPAEGRVVGKTGSLSHVRTLAGYVTTLEGEAVVFAMMANNFSVGAAEIDAIMDRALNYVVQLRR